MGHSDIRNKNFENLSNCFIFCKRSFCHWELGARFLGAKKFYFAIGYFESDILQFPIFGHEFIRVKSAKLFYKCFCWKASDKKSYGTRKVSIIFIFFFSYERYRNRASVGHLLFQRDISISYMMVPTFLGQTFWSNRDHNDTLSGLESISSMR